VKEGGGRLGPLTLGALGVVFGDIGTSPLYAFKQCFGEGGGFAPVPAHVLGILSLIFWALVGVVCVKYAIFVLCADYEGQGGTLALYALLRKRSRTDLAIKLGPLALFVLFGSAMLYGDGVITPAISVLSAVEGLNVATTAAQPYVVPITVAILLALFMIQSRGTGKIGALFGPIMLLWFAAIAVAGIVAVAAHPQILAALDPAYGAAFMTTYRWQGMLVLGAVVLAVSGVEALYADLAHFGRSPIRAAWYFIVFPALLCNYFGQGALVLGDAKALENPFYGLLPAWGVIPMVALATAATVIASQALISGAFSLTQQAIQLGYAPRLRIVHTSHEHSGQIYMPAVNAFLTVACIALVVAFRSSDKLGAAYGLAVTVTMLATSITYGAVFTQTWRRPLWQAIPVVGFFLCFDVSFLIGNLPKLAAGGWIPASIALVIFTAFTTWNDGRAKLGARLARETLPIEEFTREVETHPSLIEGTAVFLTPHIDGIPYIMHHEWLRAQLLHEHVVLMTLINEERPYADPADRVDFQRISPNLSRVIARFGFMEDPTIDSVLKACQIEEGLDLGTSTFFIARPHVLPLPEKNAFPAWRRGLYDFMIRNARPLTDALELPAGRVIEIGIDVRV